MKSIMERIESGEIEPPVATLQEQAIEVMLAYQGMADMLERLWDNKVASRKFPGDEYQRRVDKLKPLLAAYVTLKRLADAELGSVVSERREARNVIAV